MKTLKLLALAALLVIAACKAPPSTDTTSTATTPATPTTAVPTTSRDIYPDPAQAKDDLAAALKTAAATHKRILIDFGGNWCGDCVVLDRYFHDASNLPILEANFVVVHVNVEHLDANVDIAEKYEIPLKRGVPALAVLSEKGKLLYSQKGGEFEAMRNMESSSVTGFLVQWKPARSGCSAVVVNC